jgi:hypothetical protein
MKLIDDDYEYLKNITIKPKYSIHLIFGEGVKFKEFNFNDYLLLPPPLTAVLGIITWECYVYMKKSILDQKLKRMSTNPYYINWVNSIAH